MAKDFHAEYPIIRETLEMYRDLKENVMPALRKEAHSVYSQLPIYLCLQKAEELFSENRN